MGRPGCCARPEGDPRALLARSVQGAALPIEETRQVAV
jgi:hypothetical protein